MKCLIRGGRVLDPARRVDREQDILLEDGRIVNLARNLRPPRSCRIIEAQGRLIVPGLIDMHTHLRQPGREDKETIASGTLAAVYGGYTSVACMPNTLPPNDNQAVTLFILERARSEGYCHVLPIGCLTCKQEGRELAEMADMADAGAVAFSDDGRSVMNSGLMRRAMEYAAMLNKPVISHCEETTLSHEGVMHEGLMSTILGLPGIPSAAEEIMVARDIALCEITGCRLHIAHVSTAGSVALVRAAKERGLPVTAEVTPHHFSLTDAAVRGYDTHTKVNPPLRSPEDVAAILEGLADDTIDVIATDHAPHTLAEKELEYTTAPFGILGLETALSLTLTKLVAPGILTLPQAIAKLTCNPARVLGLEKGTLQREALADITIINLEKTYQVDASRFKSKSRNTPFQGWELKGAAEITIVGGEPMILE